MSSTCCVMVPPAGGQPAQVSGPGSSPAALVARRGRKCAQPSACPVARLVGRPVWNRSTRVPPSTAVSTNSTRLADGGRSALPGHPPGHDDPARWFDLDVLPAHQRPADVDGELAADHGVERRPVAHPRHHALGDHQVREHDLRRRVDVDRRRVVSHGTPPPLRPSVRAGGWARSRRGSRARPPGRRSARRSRCRVRSRCSVTRPESRSTRRWCETACCDIPTCSAMSPTATGSSRTTARIRRRLGSARALQRRRRAVHPAPPQVDACTSGT